MWADTRVEQVKRFGGPYRDPIEDFVERPIENLIVL